MRPAAPSVLMCRSGHFSWHTMHRNFAPLPIFGGTGAEPVEVKSPRRRPARGFVEGQNAESMENGRTCDHSRVRERIEPRHRRVCSLCEVLHGVRSVAVELEKVVGETNQTPLGADLGNSPKHKASKSANLFDISDHRFDDALSDGVKSLHRGIF
jgi:hypothetical protein